MGQEKAYRHRGRIPSIAVPRRERGPPRSCTSRSWLLTLSMASRTDGSKLRIGIVKLRCLRGRPMSVRMAFRAQSAAAVKRWIRGLYPARLWAGRCRNERGLTNVEARHVASRSTHNVWVKCSRLTDGSLGARSKGGPPHVPKAEGYYKECAAPVIGMHR